jgi:long-chain acyl-CoA synthetase
LEIDGDGLVWCHAPEYARFSYWRDAAATETAWRRTAFTVGDLGHLDDDGYLWLDARRDDLIVSGGVNVYPAEVEQALLDVPGVEELTVFGVEDDDWGQRVCVAVIGRPDLTALNRAAAARLAPYKRPKEVHVVDELPRTSMGKVRRSEVAAHLGLESGDGSGRD